MTVVAVDLAKLKRAWPIKLNRSVRRGGQGEKERLYCRPTARSPLEGCINPDLDSVLVMLPTRQDSRLISQPQCVTRLHSSVNVLEE
jgi:hypothetical protein